MRIRARLSNVGDAPIGSGWRCRVRRVGFPLALFAIAFHLALLFGHHHFDLSGERGFGNLPVAFAVLQTEQGTSAPDDDSRQDPAPAVPAHAPCFLCLAVHAGAHLSAGAPPLVLPIVYGRRPVLYPAGAPLIPPQRVAAFDSRGPPRV